MNIQRIARYRLLLSLFCCLLKLAAFATLVRTESEAAEPAPASVRSENQCLDQFRSGHSAWVECYGAFETDSAAQEELSNRTFDLIKGAKCGGTMRVQRTALNNAVTSNGILELDPQDILCVISTSADGSPEVTITLAPRIIFQGKRAVDVSPRIMRISSLPEFLLSPLQSGAESAFVRKQLTRELNRVLEQVFPK